MSEMKETAIDTDRKKIKPTRLDRKCIFQDCGNKELWFTFKDGQAVCAKCGAHYWS